MRDAPVEIVAPDPRWPDLFAAERDAVAIALAPWLVGVPEHIGSTAVPGLCAKPVIDVALGVDALDEMAARIAALVAIGFVYRPEYEDRIPERRYFVRAAGGTPRVHLHAVVLGERLWRQHLRFRDALREDPELLAAYAALKRQLLNSMAAVTYDWAQTSGGLGVAVRPEAWRIHRQGAGLLPARLDKRAYLGAVHEYTFDTTLGHIFVVSSDLDDVLAVGDDVQLGLGVHGVSVVGSTEGAAPDAE